MKKTLLILGFCSFMLNGAIAQEQTTPEIHSKEYVVAKTNDFTTYFSLDESGRQKVMGVVYEINQKELDLESRAAGMLPDEIRENKKVLMNEMESKLKPIVGETAWLKFEEFKKVSVYF